MDKITTDNYEQLTDHRPWGSFTILADEVDHKVKRIVVKSGQRLSLQRHKHRQEHWLIVSGIAVVTRNNDLITLAAGEAIDIALGDIHRVQNDGEEDVVFIEIQLGDYFGEDDIERLEDDYGRIGQERK
jgi:mannose-6-phosphate isomerase-like protein (cupin superfamily)